MVPSGNLMPPFSPMVWMMPLTVSGEVGAVVPTPMLPAPSSVMLESTTFPPEVNFAMRPGVPDCAAAALVWCRGGGAPFCRADASMGRNAAITAAEMILDDPFTMTLLKMARSRVWGQGRLDFGISRSIVGNAH